MVKAKIGLFGALSLDLLAGPEFAHSFDQSPGLQRFTPTTGYDYNLSSNDVAIDFGAGVELPVISFVSVFANVRYSVGLLNQFAGLIDSTPGSPAHPSSILLRSVYVMGGLLFQL